MDRTRAFAVQDVLDLDTFDNGWAPGFAFSPDGGRLAFVVQRAAARSVGHQRPFLAGNDRGELRLADLTARALRPLAASVEDGLGFYAATWSPDRRTIAAVMIDAAAIRPEVVDTGSAIGGGLYVAGIATTVIVLVILAGVKPLEERYRDRLQVRPITLAARRGTLSIDTLQEVAGPASRVCARSSCGKAWTIRRWTW